MPEYYLDLFAGIGGFALGAYWAGMKFDRHYFSEVDPYAVSVYRKRFPDAVCLGDIRGIKGAELPKGNWFLSGGFPCQDISVAGKRAGMEGSRSGLWFEYARLIGEVRPKYAVIENVGALAVRGLDRVLGSLADVGYDAEWQDIRAGDLGAPHRRERIWIVAYPQTQQRERGGTARPGRAGFTDGGEDVAYPQSDGCFQRDAAQNCYQERAVGNRIEKRQNRNEFPERMGKDMADAEFAGLERHGIDAGEPPFAESGNDGSKISDAECQGIYEPGKPRTAERSGGKRRRIFRNGLQGRAEDKKADLAHAPRSGIVRRDGELGTVEEYDGKHRGSPENGGRQWWAVEPAVHSVVDGLPPGLDGYEGRICRNAYQRANQLKCLGNAIVPQIAMLIWQRIKDIEGGIGRGNENHF